MSRRWAPYGAPAVFLGGWEGVLGGDHVVDYVRDRE